MVKSDKDDEIKYQDDLVITVAFLLVGIVSIGIYYILWLVHFL